MVVCKKESSLLASQNISKALICVYQFLIKNQLQHKKQAFKKNKFLL